MDMILEAKNYFGFGLTTADFSGCFLSVLGFSLDFGFPVKWGPLEACLASGGSFSFVFDVFTEDVEEERERTGGGREVEGEGFWDDLWLEGVSEQDWVDLKEVDP